MTATATNGFAVDESLASKVFPPGTGGLAINA
jgi:hypothetical protein